ncbi:hypothetical protein [Pseudoalteromonas viridis]|uniref:Uncharacterized protein n=1 Tax=Pseudoalteromonas viridis TaxID=339617 RepID=A0ABX7V0U8_9GAMM|nr:hypothetical protein [Pseudoalteromonas viridis]QTL34496.1 hypothetical protein J5X90_13200 [Pseudoalteromonas viridis]
MNGKERRLLDRDSLNKLYELTNPRLNPKPIMQFVMSNDGQSWEVIDPHILRGYRACKRSLESKVERYESSGVWPQKCQLGIGVFREGALVDVLIAKDLGFKPIKQSQPTLPLDDVLEALRRTRKEFLSDPDKF